MSVHSSRKLFDVLHRNKTRRVPTMGDVKKFFVLLDVDYRAAAIDLLPGMIEKLTAAAGNQHADPFARYLAAQSFNILQNGLRQRDLTALPNINVPQPPRRARTR